VKKQARLRKRMVQDQLAARGIKNPAVLKAMGEVPREEFVPDGMAEFAYEDSALPIQQAQTISQPYIVALMTEALELSPDDRVLEIGTGSGYAAAVLAQIVQEVYTVERHPSLARKARERCRRLGYDNIQVRHGDGTLGWEEHAPYDAIVVTAGGPEIPQPLLDQLSVGGRLVIPTGPTPRLQELVRVTRISEDDYPRENLGAVRFVPLIGAAGWRGPRQGVDSDPPQSPSLDKTQAITPLPAQAVEGLPGTYPFAV
jgi:protein-L-isoaspartate(D-aspartate) O-methyltransferase